MSVYIVSIAKTRCLRECKLFFLGGCIVPATVDSIRTLPIDFDNGGESQFEW
jgi:hypothetical protein